MHQECKMLECLFDKMCRIVAHKVSYIEDLLCMLIDLV